MLINSRFRKNIAFALVTCTGFLFSGCSGSDRSQSSAPEALKKGQFGYDVEFLTAHHKDAIVLRDGDAQVIVLPGYQGRVMTSTSGGLSGMSYGWINYDLIQSKEIREHMNAFGGEDRFWLGPEGGQFSIYFRKDVPFTFENWFVPKEIDTEPFDLISSSSSSAEFEKAIRLENYSGNEFNLTVNRTIRLLSRDTIAAALGAGIPSGLKVVGFESENTIKNTGNGAWTKKTGALSIWILGMFNASDSARVAIPYKTGGEEQLGKIVTDDYFGPVPGDRLKIKDGFMVFRADGKFRSKIGISPERVLPWMCSYDPGNGLLTIVQLTVHPAGAEYVNSQWKLQDDPFRGDVVNSYNDGPLPDGGQLGNFYEMESSSPAAFLGKGENMTHVQRTMHFQGPAGSLDSLCRKVLHLSLRDISF